MTTQLKYSYFSVTILLFMVFPTLANAQEQLSDTTTYQRFHKFPFLTYDNFYYPKTTINTNSGEGSLEMNEHRVTMQMALPLEEKKTYLFNSLNYTLFQQHTIFEHNSFDYQENYHAVQLSLGLIKVLPKRWRLIVNASPTIASDFRKKLTSDDFIFQMSAMATKRKSQNLEYGFGLAYTSRFGNLFVIPLLNLTYKKDKWLTIVILPAYASQYYVFNNKYRLGVKAAVYGNLYNVDFTSANSSLDVNRLSYSRITLGPEFQCKLLGDLFLNVGGGITVRNVFQIQDHDLNTELDLAVKSRAFLNIGLRVLK